MNGHLTIMGAGFNNHDFYVFVPFILEEKILLDRNVCICKIVSDSISQRDSCHFQLIATYRYKALESAKPSWIYLQNTCQHVVSCIIFGSSFILIHHIQCNVTILVLNFISMDTDLFLCQAISTGKSPMAIEKMVDGRLRKYFEEVVLMEQKYFLNDSLSIKVSSLLYFKLKLAF